MTDDTQEPKYDLSNMGEEKVTETHLEEGVRAPPETPDPESRKPTQEMPTVDLSGVRVARAKLPENTGVVLTPEPLKTPKFQLLGNLDELLRRQLEANPDSDLLPPEGEPITVEEAPSEPVIIPPIVEFKNVTKVYGTGENAFTAVKDINFKVDDIPGSGEFISILGPSGCGKSTVLRMIAGLTPQHPPTHGEVLVDGKPVLGPGAARGMVFQDYTSFDHMTVLQNVAFGLECRGMPRKEREELAKEWINKVGLNVTTDAHKYPHELSGGMRQRVAIARTLVLRPRIILMDEPFGALDPSTRMHMQSLLVGLWRELEATIFFITHSIEEAVYLGDRIYLLSSSPGTLLREIPVPAPSRGAKEMQSEPEFLEYVFDIRDTIETLEASTRAGDD